MAERLHAILVTGRPADRTRALLDLIQDFRSEDWSQALEALDRFGLRRGTLAWDLIIAAWVESDPHTAMAWTIRDNGGMARTALTAWMEDDIESALVYLESPQSREPIEVWRFLMRTASEQGVNELPRLGRLLAAIPEEQMRMMQLSPRLENIPPERLKAWVTDLEPGVRKHAIQLLKWSLKTLEAKLALGRDFPDEVGAEYYGAIHGKWMETDEAAALASFETLELGPVHQAALAGISMELGRKGRFEEAFALTRRFPQEATHLLLTDLMNECDLDDPELVLQEIPRLEYEWSRLERYRATLQLWLDRDPEAARRWMSENEVPVQVRRDLEGK